MGKGITGTAQPSRATYAVLEEMVRFKVQEYIQEILEDEVRVFLAGTNLSGSSWLMQPPDIGTATGRRESSLS